MGKKSNVDGKSLFNFVTVTADVIHKKLSGLNGKKAKSVDQVPPRLVKAGAAHLCETIATLVNISITHQAVFPDMLKRAEVLPLFKKGDATNKSNRPVSILPCISKILEGILSDQLQRYFEPIMCTQVSSFRKGFNCQTVLADFT